MKPLGSGIANGSTDISMSKLFQTFGLVMCALCVFVCELYGNLLDLILTPEIQRLYIGTLGCNYLLWPAVQFINFLAVPKHLQVPFSSSVGVLWNCFLSMRNASHPAN